MLSSQIPVKFPTIWATGADPGEITNPIPTPPQAGGRASLTIGWPDPTFQPLASGGNPPWGKDFNGIFFMITAWLQWAAAGGPVSYDSTFQTAIGGYPKFALIQAATGDRYWLSDVDNNLTNPDAAGAGWHLFPDVIVQKQAGNYGQDIGSSNAFRVTLTPLPASNAAIIGAPIRVRAASANTINNPTIAVDNVAANGPMSMINANGTPIGIGQISGSGCIFMGLYDGTIFRVLAPAPSISGPTASGALTGVIYPWAAETVPTWGLECNGAQYAITSFPNLFNIIGFRFGGDGVNNFRVPDLRGAFMRGWDHGRGLDPNATTRTASPLGSPTVVGDHVGSWEQSSLRAADLNGSKILIYGDPQVLTDGKFGLPVIGVSASSPGIPGASFTPPTYNLGGLFQWNVLPFANTPLEFGGNPGFNPAVNPGGPVGTSAAQQLAGLLQLSGNAALETRPINMDVMYVIAY